VGLPHGMDVPVFIIQYTKINQDPSQAAILWPEKYGDGESLYPAAQVTTNEPAMITPSRGDHGSRCLLETERRWCGP